MIPASIEMRVAELINNGMTSDVMDALRMAFEQEERFILSLISSAGFCSSRGKVARDHISNNIWRRHNCKKGLTV